jgi:hypothetical protein
MVTMVIASRDDSHLSHHNADGIDLEDSARLKNDGIFLFFQRDALKDEKIELLLCQLLCENQNKNKTVTKQ